MYIWFNTACWRICVQKKIIILIIQEVGIKIIKTIRVKLDSRTFIDIRYIDLVNSVAEVYCPIARY